MISSSSRIAVASPLSILTHARSGTRPQRATRLYLHVQQRNATTFKLNTGASIPAIGFGTWQDKDAQEGAVKAALKAGYRHIDGARVYGTEAAVGKAIKASGISRDEIFLTTKLWNNAHHPDDVEAQLDESLKDLQVDYLDLWLMHWPSAFARGTALMPKDESGKIKSGNTPFTDTWAAMTAMVTKGKVRAIGVSNFSKGELEELLHAGSTSIVPAVHQLECHPYLQQRDFSEWHKERGIHITQYSPFGNQNPIYSKGEEMGKLIEDPALVEIGQKYGKSGSQVALAWGIAQGHSVIPKSKTPSRIDENFYGDFELDQHDLESLKKLDKQLRFNNPSDNFGWKFYSDLDGA